MTTYIDKVREALRSLRRVAPVLSYEEEAEDALDALQAHEAEVKELKRDAERYRWLRDGYDGTASNADRPVIVINRAGEIPELDAAIDAALAKVKP